PESDRYVAASADGSVVTLAATGGTVFGTLPGRAARVSPDARTAVSFAAGPGADGRATVWALHARPPRALCERAGVTAVAFSPDGRLVMVSGTGDTVVLDTETGREVRRFKSLSLCLGLPVHPTRPWVALYPDGGSGLLAVDYLTGDEVGRVGRDRRPDAAVSWHPTRPVLAFRDPSVRIHLVDVTTDRDVLPPLDG